MSVAFALLQEAMVVLRPLVVRTPVLESPAINAACGRRVLCKAESLQRTGSFKFRGASFRVARLSDDERRRGVIAFSSGNFAQALAEAGRLAGVRVTIVMPADAPPAKIDATRGYGAEVVLSEHGSRNREEAANELAMQLADRHGFTRLHPFDDKLVVAGQGSAGIEMIEQCREQGVTLDVFLAPVGGGGLLAGSAFAVRQLSATTRVFAVEPEGYDDTARSLASGARERVQGSPRSLCDALQAASPGAVPFAVLKDTVESGIAVSDDEVRRAVQCAFRDLKLVLEPSGAVALAALLAGKGPKGEGPAGVILSGGNIALQDFARIAA